MTRSRPSATDQNGATASVADDMLRSFFERWRRLEDEKRTISDDLKDLFAEAKGMGFDTKAMRAVFREETGDKLAAEEFDAVCDLYRSSLRGLRAHPARSARENIEEFDAETGEITGSVKAGDKLAISRSELAAHSADESAAPRSRAESLTEHDSLVGPAPAEQVGAPIAEVFEPPAFLVKERVNLRPLCLNPSECAGYGSHTCHRCLKAAEAVTHAGQSHQLARAL